LSGLECVIDTLRCAALYAYDLFQVCFM